MTRSSSIILVFSAVYVTCCINCSDHMLYSLLGHILGHICLVHTLERIAVGFGTQDKRNYGYPDRGFLQLLYHIILTMLHQL
jgi:hypothetical protein